MIGYANCEFILYDTQSLKEKRAVLQRVLTRTKQKFNVSVSEIDFQDSWQRTKIGFVAISSSKVQTERELNNTLKFLDSFPEIERTLTSYEWF
ncbi:DUF503 domain-containing protein [Bacillus weihaiensis]|uniref:DUF503 domain-containing protein n=1 Tax=Bacillus weihaiensis TaxID=1547283 RepID=A0A1L3MSA7_9BACI|nr:DUF503 domain-containing protein [Bacillus weihaiensis]APH05216.1 hypothetical protein A9C19_10885 [Bacillus weihaiensis]